MKMGYPARRSWPSHPLRRPVPTWRAASHANLREASVPECYRHSSCRNRATDRSPLQGGGPDALLRTVKGRALERTLGFGGRDCDGTLRLGQGRKRGDVLRIPSRGRPATKRASRFRRPLPHRKDCRLPERPRQPKRIAEVSTT